MRVHSFKKPDGELWLYHAGDLVSDYLVAGGWDGWEPKVRELLRAKSYACAIDVGAHVGSFAIWAALSGVASHVYAFEPDFDNCRWLRENITLNKLDGLVEVRRCALGDDDRLIRVEPWKQEPNNTGARRVVADTNGKLRMRTLDDLLERDEIKGPIGLLKVDAEGWDAAVLAGAEKLLERFRPDIVVEDWKEGHWLKGWCEVSDYRLVACVGPKTYYCEPIR